MNIKKYLQQPIKQTLTFTLVIVSVHTHSLAKTPTNNVPAKKSSPKTLEFKPPKRGAPGNRRGAGSRPLCPASKKPFTAIVPVTNWGDTISPYPTFWLYVPYQKGSVELRLLDENTKIPIAETTLSVQNGPGIMGLRLPQSFPPLVAGKSYRWQFFFLCNKSDSFAVNGVIRRIAITPVMERELQARKTLREQIITYAKYGLWHETMTLLAQLRQHRPGNRQFSHQWSQLLHHPFVRLENMVSEPIAPCYIFQSQD